MKSRDYHWSQDYPYNRKIIWDYSWSSYGRIIKLLSGSMPYVSTKKTLQNGRRRFSWCEMYTIAQQIWIYGLDPAAMGVRRAKKFIADLTKEYRTSLVEWEQKRLDKILAKVVLLPTCDLLRRNYEFGQTIPETRELFSLSARDVRSKAIVDRVGDSSLH